MDINLLKKIGFSDKAAQVYVGLLQLGPSPVRKLADFCQLNRGSVYDALKWLEEQGLVSIYDQKSKQHFVAEHPERLQALLVKEKETLDQAENDLKKTIPELEALYNNGGDRPVAKYFAEDELSEILTDVLETCASAGETMYRVYSTEGIREVLYKNFPTFSDVRVGKGIAVRVLALGKGGSLRGLDERKWIQVTETKPTYIILFCGKTAYISLNNAGEAVGVVIDNDGIYHTQKQIFDSLWERA